VEDGEPLAESVDLAHCQICLGGKEASEELGEFLAHNGAGHFFHKQCLSTALKQDTRCPGCREDGLSYYSVDTEGRDSDGKLLISAAAEPVLGCKEISRIASLGKIIADRDYAKFRRVMKQVTTGILQHGLSKKDGELLKAAFFQATALADVELVEDFMILCRLMMINRLPREVSQSIVHYQKVTSSMFQEAALQASAQGKFALLSVLLKYQNRAVSPSQEIRGNCLLAASVHGKRDLLALILDNEEDLHPRFLEQAIRIARTHTSPETARILHLLTKTLWQARIAQLCNIIFPLWILCIIPYAILDHLKNK
jgi:hypothetical protein